MLGGAHDTKPAQRSVPDHRQAAAIHDEPANIDSDHLGRHRAEDTATAIHRRTERDGVEAAERLGKDLGRELA